LWLNSLSFSHHPITETQSIHQLPLRASPMNRTGLGITACVVGLSVLPFAAGASNLGTAVDAQAPAATYQLVENWAQLPAGQQFGSISGVAVDSKGVVYALRRNDGQVLIVDASGHFLGSWKTGAQLDHNIRIDRDGFLWMTDRDGGEVKKFRTDGSLLLAIGTMGKPFNGPDIFHGPTDVLVTVNGDFFVSDGYWNSRVVKFNKDGKYLSEFGRPGRAPGQIGLPHVLGQDSQGRLVVSDRCDRPGLGPSDERRVNPGCNDTRIEFFDIDGRPVEQHLDVQPNGTAMTVVGDTIYASNSSGGGTEIVILNARTGKKVNSFQVVGGAHALAVDATGDNIYLADNGRFDAGKRFGNSGALRCYRRTAK
jgi:DNA-binding beta-propeller fold protein YncE